MSFLFCILLNHLSEISVINSSPNVPLKWFIYHRYSGWRCSERASQSHVGVTLCCVQFHRHIRGCSAWSSTLIRTCPSTQSPSWRCTGARNGRKCPLTSTPYQRPPIAACCKVLSTISDLFPIARRDTRARPSGCYQLRLAWKTVVTPCCDLCEAGSGLLAFFQELWCFLKPWLAIICLKSENKFVLLYTKDS